MPRVRLRSLGLLGSVATLGLAGWHAAARAPTAAPAPDLAVEIPADVVVERDVPYSAPNGLAQTLDIARPRAASGPLPAIVHIHGGGWSHRSKSLRAALEFALNGFVGVSIDFRQSSVAPFPAGVHDCKASIRWLRAHAATYGIDPERIGVTGRSSGGNLAALLGTSGGDPYLEGDGGNPGYSSRVQAVVEHFGPTDMLQMDARPNTVRHGTPDSPESRWLGHLITDVADVAARANPITYVDARDPPTLIFHGEDDSTVIFEQSQLLYEALRKAGVETRLIAVKGAGHDYKPVAPGAGISPDVTEIAALEVRWFASHLGAAGGGGTR